MQNAGAADAGTGLNKSNIIQKISLDEAQTFANGSNTTAEVNVTTVTPNPNIINSNGQLDAHRPQMVLAEYFNRCNQLSWSDHLPG